MASTARFLLGQDTHIHRSTAQMIVYNSGLLFPAPDGNIQLPKRKGDNHHEDHLLPERQEDHPQGAERPARRGTAEADDRRGYRGVQSRPTGGAELLPGRHGDADHRIRLRGGQGQGAGQTSLLLVPVIFCAGKPPESTQNRPQMIVYITRLLLWEHDGNMHIPKGQTPQTKKARTRT